MNNDKPFPDTFSKISLDRSYSSEEYQKIVKGEHSSSMDKKWNIDFEAPYLYIRRSWTGNCLFKVKFEKINNNYLVAEALANRDDCEYGETLNERDSLLAAIKIDQLAGRDVEEAWDKYVKWIMDKESHTQGFNILKGFS